MDRQDYLMDQFNKGYIELTSYIEQMCMLEDKHMRVSQGYGELHKAIAHTGGPYRYIIKDETQRFDEADSETFTGLLPAPHSDDAMMATQWPYNHPILMHTRSYFGFYSWNDKMYKIEKTTGHRFMLDTVNLRWTLEDTVRHVRAFEFLYMPHQMAMQVLYRIIRESR